MMKYSLEDIKKKVNELALKINAPTNLLPDYGQQIWDANPYIEVDNLGLMYYIISERGQEYERLITDQIDDLLYRIFSSVTFSMASDYELKNRIDDKDCRRIIFDKQEELLGVLSDSWKQKEKAEHQTILKNHPFDDLAGLRATYCRQLRQQGITEAEINKLAYEKYPRN
ncbi:Imm63 family immunity protein [Flavobacterium sp. 3-210]